MIQTTPSSRPCVVWEKTFGETPRHARRARLIIINYSYVAAVSSSPTTIRNPNRVLRECGGGGVSIHCTYSLPASVGLISRDRSKNRYYSIDQPLVRPGIIIPFVLNRVWMYLWITRISNFLTVHVCYNSLCSGCRLFFFLLLKIWIGLLFFSNA